MNDQLQNSSDNQKETWNKVSKAWKKWNDVTMQFLKPMGDAIIQALTINKNDVVLDIASGTGEPAFSIAALATDGKVYATDISEEMLAIARDYSSERKIRNVEFKVADVSSLPFDDHFFDKISCRMGFMFFPDIQLATDEMFRVCRHGGKIATCVWDRSENNDWYTTILKVIARHIEIPRQPANAPGMFRCAKPGLMKELFEYAGFKNVQEENISGKLDYGTPENYWLNRTEISEAIMQLLSKTDEATRKKIKDELLEVCNTKLTNGRLILNYASLVISAEK